MPAPGVRKGLPLWTLAVGGASLTIVGLGAFACTRDLVSGSRSGLGSAVPISTVTVPSMTSTPAPPVTPAPTETNCGEGMVKIPGGTFSMGSEMVPFEKPVHAVSVKTFCIDRTEVTTAAYEACVRANKCTEALTRDTCNTGVAARKDHPINCVTWDQAAAFCAVQNKRLPTEEEWEFVARGSEGRPYPWGSITPSNQACWSGEENDVGKVYRKETCPVSAYPSGNTPLGVADMAGNVWEWTASFYCPYEQNGDKCANTKRVFRGGSWNDSFVSNLSSSYRSWNAPLVAYSGIGFRCSRDSP